MSEIGRRWPLIELRTRAEINGLDVDISMTVDAEVLSEPAVGQFILRRFETQLAALERENAQEDQK